MDSFKPCPFCGGNVEIISDGNIYDGRKWCEMEYAECQKCYMRSPSIEVDEDNKKYFLELWNSRPDVVPKNEEGAECPTCHGTGRIGTTNWLTKNMTKKQIAEEKAQAIAEHEQYIKTEYAREIFEEIEREIKNHGITYTRRRLAELKKKYTEEQK